MELQERLFLAFAELAGWELPVICAKPDLHAAHILFGALFHGTLVSMQLVENGRTVVAAARDASKAQEVFTELGLDEGLNKGSGQVQHRPVVSTDRCTQSQLYCTAALDT